MACLSLILYPTDLTAGLSCYMQVFIQKSTIPWCQCCHWGICARSHIPRGQMWRQQPGWAGQSTMWSRSSSSRTPAIIRKSPLVKLIIEWCKMTGFYGTKEHKELWDEIIWNPPRHKFYVPLPYITYLIDSCPISQSPAFFVLSVSIKCVSGV